MKNITLSAPEELIEKARKKAQAEGSSLNERFREWLAHYLGTDTRLDEFRQLMKKLERVQAPANKPNREEINER